MRIFRVNSIFSFLYEFIVIYPSPSNLNYFYNFGFFAMLCLVFQIVTGIFLAMHYVPFSEQAFDSMEHIMRAVKYGFLLRYLHANGASMFFIAVYMHFFKGLYYGSYIYPRQLVWVLGVLILFIMILTAFLGYVLPWGQMSFWAATVITNLVSAIPFVGSDIVYWLWGGFSVDNPTLQRFFSFHYLFPFIIAVLVLFHLIALHTWGSTNPLGVNFKIDVVYFTPYFMLKDFYGAFIFFIFASLFIYFMPNYLGHSDNYILANPLSTPAHIVPEWYFLPFYAILRSIPDKLLGVLMLVLSILVLIVLPWTLNSPIRTATFAPQYRAMFWTFVVTCILLGWIGGKPIESPYYELGQLFTFYYFFYLLVLLLVILKVEKIIFFSFYVYRSKIFQKYRKFLERQHTNLKKRLRVWRSDEGL